MKILFVIDGLSKGGCQRRFCEVVKGMRENNIDCEIIALSDVVDYPYIYDYGYKIHLFERKVKKDISVLFKINDIIKSFQPDIIHSWGTMSPIYLLPLLFLRKYSFVNSMIYDSKRPLFSKIDIRARLTFPFSDIILANSNAGLKAYRVKRNKAEVIYNGFDFKRIGHLKDKEAIRETYHIHTRKVVGMVGSFNRYKDYETYIQAAIELCTKHDDLTIVSIGDGINLSHYKSIIPENLKDRIVFTGMIMDVESFVNIFDIGVLSTFGEGISNSIMEYMALKKPVVATALGGVPELVVDGLTGFLIPPSSPSSLVDKIEYLLSNPDEAEKMGLAGEQRINDCFSFENMVKSTLRVYNDLLNKHK